MEEHSEERLEYYKKKNEISEEWIKLATETGLSLNKVREIYHLFNKAVYLLDSDFNPGKSAKMYDSNLEDLTLKLTKIYLNMKNEKKSD